jgi:hypothetical protein
MLDFEAGAGDINNFWALVDAFNNHGVNVSLAYIPHWYWGDIGEPDLSPLAFSQIQLVSSAYPGGVGMGSDIYRASGGDNGEGWTGYGGSPITCWQFTNNAEIAGFKVDCNAFKGDNLDLLFTF